MKKFNWLNVVEHGLGGILTAAAIAFFAYVIGEEKPSSLLWITSGALLIIIVLIMIWRGFRERLKAIWQWAIVHWQLIVNLTIALLGVIALYSITNQILVSVLALVFSLLIFILTRSYYLSSQKNLANLVEPKKVNEHYPIEIVSEGKPNQIKKLRENLFKAKIPPKLIYQFLFIFFSGIVFTIFAARVTNTDLSHVDFLSHNTPIPATSRLLRVNPDKFAEIVFVIDTSDIFSLETIKHVLRGFSAKLLPNDRIGLIGYNNKDVKLILPLTQIGKTGDELFLVKLNDLKYSSEGVDSHFYDAIMFSTNDVEFQRNSHKSVIIFVNSYRLRPSETKYLVEDISNSIERSANNGTVIIPISLGSTDSDIMKLIASAAGTEVYESNGLVWIDDLINKYLQ